MRIEVGYGLEGALTDATSRRIIGETITPLFRQGDFYGGINAGLEQIMRIVDGEPLPEPDRSWTGRRTGTRQAAAVPVHRVPGARLGPDPHLRPRHWRAASTGGIAGGIVWLIAKLLGIALLAGLVAAVFSLFAGIPGRGWSSSARHGGWGGGWGGLGGGSGGLGGGGFGGGGFSGGGGGFGGGGASGGW